jgi:hypothetical protein
MPECVVVIFFNSLDMNFASWHFLKRQIALWLFKNSPDAKYLVVAVSLKPQRVLVDFFSH